MWKSLALALSLTAGCFTYGAESARIKGDGCSLEFAKDKLFVANAANRRQLLLGKLFYTWTAPVLTPADAAVGDDGIMKVTYKVALDPKAKAKAKPEDWAKLEEDAKSISLEALCTVEGRKITITYNLSSPVKPDGAMFEIVGQDGAAKQPLYAATVWQMRPFGGSAVAGKDGSFRQFAGKNGAIWLKLPGNTGWSSGWAEHAGFRKSGDLYTTTLEFIVTPPDFTGDDMTAIRHGYPASIAFDGDKLKIRNLGATALENAVLSLGDKEETLTIAANELLTREGGDASSASLKVGDKSIYTQKK